MALSHRGRVREHNEDAFLLDIPHCPVANPEVLVAQADLSGQWLVAVADGLGGHQAGEVASRMVVEGLYGYNILTETGIRQRLMDIHDQIHQAGLAHPDRHGMGSTVAGMFSGPEGIYGFNVGDARIYLRQNRTLKLISRDDTLAQEFFDAGYNIGGNDRQNTRWNLLTQSMGCISREIDVKPHFYPITTSFQGFLLCTDGLTDMVKEEDIQRIWASGQPTVETAHQMLQSALEGGGRDNITLILAQDFVFQQ